MIADLRTSGSNSVDLALRAGELVALVGPSGGGKSTVAALLSRFYDPTAGWISLDGVDLRKLDTDWLRSRVGVVAQEPVLFGASIRENILYGRPEATDDEVYGAAQAANAEGFIQRMPDGYETQVGERGVRLSGGQKQRIAIARAMVLKPKLVVLDEPTSALDVSVQAQIIDLLLNLQARHRLSYIFISHDLKVVRALSDEVLVMRRGQVVEHDTAKAIFENPSHRYTQELMTSAYEWSFGRHFHH